MLLKANPGSDVGMLVSWDSAAEVYLYLEGAYLYLEEVYLYLEADLYSASN